MQITNKRIVPLEHKIYLSEKQSFVCKNEKDEIQVENINKSLVKLEKKRNWEV